MNAKQTPLIDLLKNVPRTARLLVEENASTRSIPVGKLCADAVEELERAQALARTVMADMTSYDEAVCPMCEGKSPPKEIKSSLKPNSLYTVGMAMSDFIGENNLRWSDTLRAVFEKAERDYVDEMVSSYEQGRDHGCEMEPITDEKLNEIIKQHITISDTHLLAAVYMICREVEAAHGIREEDR